MGVRFEAGSLAEAPEQVSGLLKQREEARNSKDFALSDRLRAEIEALGYEVKDTSGGQEISKKTS
jgi:cysteinyl-tRNA synthetase